MVPQTTGTNSRVPRDHMLLIGYALYFIIQDLAQGRLREFVAHAVGGETVLARMIEEGKAVAYMCNGHQYVRTCDHRWEDTTALTNVTQMQGKSAGKGALGDNTIESLCDFFQNVGKRTHRTQSSIGYRRRTLNACTC